MPAAIWPDISPSFLWGIIYFLIKCKALPFCVVSFQTKQMDNIYPFLEAYILLDSLNLYNILSVSLIWKIFIWMLIIYFVPYEILQLN